MNLTVEEIYKDNNLEEIKLNFETYKQKNLEMIQQKNSKISDLKNLLAKYTHQAIGMRDQTENTIKKNKEITKESERIKTLEIKKNEEISNLKQKCC